MVRRFILFGGWLAVVAAVTLLTWQIVSAADEQVSARPIAPLNVAAPVIATSSTTSTTIGDVDTTTATTATTSTAPSPAETSTTSTTTPPTGSTTPTTSTTQPDTSETWQARSVKTAGGTVLLRYRPGEVAYQSASPAPGYQVEVEKPGPPEVKVEFESESNKVEVQAAWSDGDLRVEVSGESKDD